MTAKSYARGKPTNKAVNRPIDFRRLRVLARRDHGDVALVTVALAPSDAILAGIGIGDALVIHAVSPGASILRPIIEVAGQPALVMRCQCLPVGLVVGRLLDMSVVFRMDETFDHPAVEAVVSTIRVRPQKVVAAPITLPQIRAFAPPIDLDLPDDPVAQRKAEEAISAAIAYRLHTEARAAEAARKAVQSVHVELDDTSLLLAHATDHGINRELRRLSSRPPARWMRRPTV